jgi:glutathione S-transferase
MSDFPDISLHYFDLRGRGQAIRALLTHHEVPFADNRIVLAKDNSNWPQIRGDRDITGDFQKLPFLHWGDLRLNEALVILDFLDRKLADADTLDDLTWSRHRQLTSSAFLDLLVACINLIWCDIFHPETNVAAATGILRRRMPMHLATLNQTLQDWDWLAQMHDRPVMASDAVLWEALDAVRLTFDEHVSFDELDAVSTFYDECPGIQTFKKLLVETPMTITGRPGEPDALLVIHGSLSE